MNAADQYCTCDSYRVPGSSPGIKAVGLLVALLRLDIDGPRIFEILKKIRATDNYFIADHSERSGCDQVPQLPWRFNPYSSVVQFEFIASHFHHQPLNTYSFLKYPVSLNTPLIISSYGMTMDFVTVQ